MELDETEITCDTRRHEINLLLCLSYMFSFFAFAYSIILLLQSTCDIRRQQPIPRSRVDVWVEIHRFDSGTMCLFIVVCILLAFHRCLYTLWCGFSGGTNTKRRDRACDTKKQSYVISFLVSAQYQVTQKNTKSKRRGQEGTEPLHVNKKIVFFFSL